MGEIYKNLSLENLEGEEWLPVVGYENYQVSNLGRVKSLNYLHTKQEKILKQHINNKGYLIIMLCKDGKRKTFQVHRIVAQAFIENPNNYPTVNHNNEIKTDNRVSNLCWMDYSQQQRYGTCIQRRVAHTDYKFIVQKRKIDYKARTAKIDYKARTAKMDYKEISRKRVASTDYKSLSLKRVASTDYKAIAEKHSKRVYQYSIDGELVAIWQSTQECGRNGFNQRNISACCRGERKSHKGYLWSYTELIC